MVRTPRSRGGAVSDTVDDSTRAMVGSVFRFAPTWAEKFEEEMVEGDHYPERRPLGRGGEGEFGDRVATLGRVTYKR